MSWIKIEGEELQRLRSRFDLPPETVKLEAARLQTPFYQDGELVRMSYGLHTGYIVAAGQGEISAREYYPLNGSGDDIHTANKAARLVITEENAGDYLHFFHTFLRSGDGEPFAIVESLNGFGVFDKDGHYQCKPKDMRLAYAGARAEGDAFTFRGYVAYQGMLFGVLMLVRKDGQVEMLEDDPIGSIVRLH